MLQNDTNRDAQQIDTGDVVSGDLLSVLQEKWIDYCALGGLITTDSDSPDKVQDIKVMPITKFSEELGVPRQTLYRWKETIPNFGGRVRTRRNEIFSLSRETALWNRLYLIAMNGKGQPAVEAIKLLLGHFGELNLAPQRLPEPDQSNMSWADLINKARTRDIVSS